MSEHAHRIPWRPPRDSHRIQSHKVVEGEPRVDLAKVCADAWAKLSIKQRASLITLILTVAYLAIELPFNARLLDIVGRVSSLDEIHHIEVWGRLISGYAVALLVWGVFVIPAACKKGWAFRDTFVTMLIIGAVPISGVYWGEKALVDHLVNKSSGSQRHAALELTLLSSAMKSSAVDLDGINLTPAIAESASGKTFLAVFPFMAETTPNLDHKIHAALRALVTQNIKRQMPSPGQMYNEQYVPLTKSMIFQYRAYQRAHNALNRAISHGVPRSRALRVFHGRVGPVSPYVHTADQFVHSSHVSNLFRKRLGLPGHVTPSLHWNLDQFRRIAFTAILHARVRTKVRQVSADARSFEDGHKYASIGRRAREAEIVPAIALAFSMAGAVLHVMKFLLLVIGLVAPKWAKLAKPVAAVWLLLAAALLPPANAITQSPVNTMLGEWVVSETPWPGGVVADYGVNWVMRIQSFAYPVNEWLRVHALHGYKFGPIPFLHA